MHPQYRTMDVSRFKGFTLRWSKAALDIMLHNLLETELLNEEFLAGGFHIRAGVPDKTPLIRSADQQELLVNLPLHVDFKKPEGLFSIEGKGRISLEIRLWLDFPGETPEWGMEILAHHWMESPVVTMGSLDFPVEFLADFIIKRIKEKHWTRWMDNLHDQLNIEKSLKILSDKYLRNIPVGKNPDWYLNVNIHQFVWVGFKDEKTHVSCVLYIDYALMVSDRQSSLHAGPPRCLVLPVSSLLQKSSYPVEISVSYTGMEKMIVQFTRGMEIGGRTFKVENVSIRQANQLEMNLVLSAPIEGSVTLSAMPFFVSDTQKFDVTGIKVDITADKFLLQLSAPLLEKIVRQRIEEWFPFSVQPLLQDIITKLKKDFAERQMIFFPKEVTVQKTAFDLQGVKVNLAIGQCLIAASDQSWSVSTM